MILNIILGASLLFGGNWYVDKPYKGFPDTKALFMEEDQLAKIINNQEKISSINGDISKQAGFEDLLGRNSLDNLTQIKNDFSAISAQFVNTLGPAISGIVSGVAAFTGYLADSPNTVPSSLTATSAQTTVVPGSLYPSLNNNRQY